MIMKSITQIIKEWDSGNEQSLDELILFAYERLHKIAKTALGDFGIGSTLQTTELINEFYCSLKSRGYSNYHDSAHFFAIAFCKLRQLLQERYRRRNAQKRDFGIRLPMEEIDNIEFNNSPFEFAVCSEAFHRMSRIDGNATRLMELRLFWEFSVPEILEILRISEATYYRRWEWAKAWLKLYCDDMIASA